MIEPPPACLHHRLHRLGGEELVPQVHREPLVPVLGRHALERVALVVGGVVDQDRDRAVGVGRGSDRRAQRLDVAQVARQEQRRRQRPRRPAPRRSCLAAVAVDVDEGDLAALLAERRTIAAPMPLPPPVTRTERPFKLG